MIYFVDDVTQAALAAIAMVLLYSSENGTAAHGVTRVSLAAVAVVTYCTSYGHTVIFSALVSAAVLHEVLNVNQHDVVRVMTVLGASGCMARAIGVLDESITMAMARNAVLAALAMCETGGMRVKWPVLDTVAILTAVWPGESTHSAIEILAPLQSNPYASIVRIVLALLLMANPNPCTTRPIYAVMHTVAAHPVLTIGLTGAQMQRQYQKAPAAASTGGEIEV